MFVLTAALALSPALAGMVADPKIINGEDASTDDFPMTGGAMMQADLVYSGRSYPLNILVCSSTLIAPDVVLLAAHCVDEFAITYGQGDLENVEWAWSRQADLSDWDGMGRPNGFPDDAVPVTAWVKHDGFDLMRMGLGLSENDDIALLFLEEPVLDVPLGYLPTKDEAKEIETGREVWIVGWGQQIATSGNQMPPDGSYAYKQMALTEIAEVGEPEFQVGPTEDSGRKCHGDSGGPTFLEVDTDSTETMRVIGVTSHSYDMTDCENKGGVDTRVDHYLDWIEEQMVTACEDGTRVWCDTPGILPAPSAEAQDPEEEDDGGDSDEDEKAGLFACGCDSGAGLAGGLWALGGVGALVMRRRRSR